ncbi:MAG TPA: transketolase [Coprothermobacter sp.]|jgi:transketolase|nr:transketolase [Coprothermobacter sp.]
MQNDFKYWEKMKDISFELMDIMLNYRQSGHPGGSHSKTQMLLALMFGGKMRYDIRRPEYRFSDRFILAAGHTVPVVDAVLAMIGDAFRLRFTDTGDQRFFIAPERIVLPEDLLRFRHRDGLPGHAEFGGKTMFLKFNTGPSAHGLPASVGEALALKKAGLSEFKVFAIEGEGALTAGGSHEAKNGAWGYGLGNLYWLVDWNDFGIDDRRTSSVVFGGPDEWFASHGWRVFGTLEGHDWDHIWNVFVDALDHPDELLPTAMYFKTRKGHGYGVYDNKSHGTPIKKNAPLFWEIRKGFMEKYGVEYDGFGKPAPEDKEEELKQFKNNIDIALSVLRNDRELVEYITDRLTEIGESLPKAVPTFKLDVNPYKDPDIFDYTKYPEEMFAQPGEKVPNRAALIKWGSYVNAVIGRKYNRPLIIATSADLTESTNLHGFGQGWGDNPGWGWYDRSTNIDGAILPSEITEFMNSGVAAGMVTVNMAENPYEEFNGYWVIMSTYGSFAYLKYGPMRLLSQLAQDCPLKVGKVIWVVGHSGPETAEDSRTHFGVFAPGVSQLFPKGKIINLYPWEHNEVPVVLGEALSKDVPIVALHLTRPPITIPDRKAMGIAHYFEAAKGAYLINDFDPARPKQGTVIVRGTSVTANLISILPEIRKAFNVKIIAAISRELFDMQPEHYRMQILPSTDWADSMVITNEALSLMQPWLFSKLNEEYSLSSDWDNNWRTGGTLEEVIEEAHLDPQSIFQGIERFVSDREKRLARLKELGW